MKKAFIKLSLALFALFLVFACTKDDDAEFMALAENGFKFMPEKPSSADEVSIITYDCAYNQLSEVIRDGFKIDVVKNFNSMMKQPCILENDTISLGKLEAGTYQINFIIMDNATNILASDKIFHTETQQLVVK